MTTSVCALGYIQSTVITGTAAGQQQKQHLVQLWDASCFLAFVPWHQKQSQDASFAESRVHINVSKTYHTTDHSPAEVPRQCTGAREYHIRSQILQLMQLLLQSSVCVQSS